MANQQWYGNQQWEWGNEDAEWSDSAASTAPAHGVAEMSWGDGWGQSEEAGQEEGEEEPDAEAAMDDDKTFYAFYTEIGADGSGVTGTLVGDYQEEGVNHGRRYYRKQGKANNEHDVYLYYWDERDGPSLNGWWFGNHVGGRQVWARNQETSPLPPQTGWCIPWDGEATSEFQVGGTAVKKAHDLRLAKEAAELKRKEAAAARRKQQIAVWIQRVDGVKSHVKSLESATDHVLEQASHAQDGDISTQVAAIDAVIAPMRQNMVAVMGAHRIVTQETAPIVHNAPELKEEMASIAAKVKELQKKLKETTDRLSSARQATVRKLEEAKQKAKEEARYRELEPVQTQRLQDLIEANSGSVVFAEDEVEKVAIAAAPLEVEGGEDVEQVMLEAIAETEARFKAAHNALIELKRQISEGQKEASQFIPSLREAAVLQFAELLKKHEELQKKLSAFKHVRKEYQQRAKDRQILNELSEKVASVEVQLDQADAMPLESAADAKEIERLVSAAQSQLTLAAQRVEKKCNEISSMSASPLHDIATELRERTQLVQDKLKGASAKAKETKAQLLADILVREITEKVRIVEDGLQKLLDTPLPEPELEQPLSEVKLLFNQAEKDIQGVKTSQAEAQAFLAVKIAEARRSLDEVGKEAVTHEIEVFKSRLAEGKTQLERFRSTLNDKMRGYMLKEVDENTATALAEVEKLREATLALKSRSVIGEPVTPELLTALQNAAEAEEAAKESLVIAYKSLVAKTSELTRFAGSAASSGAELGKLQSKQSSLMRAVNEHEKSIQLIEERVRVKELLSEMTGRLSVGEAEVDKVQTAAMAVVDQEDPPAELCKELETVASSATQKLKTTMKIVDLKLRSSKGAMKEELEAMRNSLASADERLRGLANGVKEQQERHQVTELILAAQQKLESAEAATQHALEANAPLSSGTVSTNPVEVKSMLDNLEKTIVEGEIVVKAAQGTLGEKFVLAKKFSELSVEKATQELSALQTRADDQSSKLTELRKSLLEHKRSCRSQMLSATISNVEAEAGKLKSIVGKLDGMTSDNKLAEMSEESIVSLGAEATAAEKAAQQALVDGKAFVQAQLKEAQNLTGSERQQYTKEMSTLQSKLTQSQIEVGKLAKHWSQVKQRCEASRVVKGAAETVERLQAMTEAASKIATPIIEAKDKGALSGSVLLQHVGVALEAHIADGADIDVAQLCTKLCPGTSASRSEFVAFIIGLPELTGRSDLDFTEGQAGDMFTSLAEEDALDVAKFQELFLDRYICVEGMPLFDTADGDTDRGMLEVGEVVRVLTEMSGAARVQCILGRDGSKAWVSPMNSEGNYCLEASTTEAWQIESIDAYCTAMHARCTQAAEEMDRSLVEVKSLKEGPLAASKGKLMQQRMRITAEQAKALNFKSKVGNLKTSILQGREKEVKAAQEARQKDDVLRYVREATKIAEQIETIVTGIADRLKSKDKDLKKDFSATEITDMKKRCEGAMSDCAEVKILVDKALKAHEVLPSSLKTQLRETRLDCAKLNSRVTTAERRCKANIEPLRVAYEASVRSELLAANTHLRAAFRKTEQPSNKVFEEVAEGNSKMSEAQFDRFVVSALSDSGLSAEQASLVFHEFGNDNGGLTKLEFASVVEEFLVCTKGVVMTQTFDLSEAQAVRKIEPGELFEVLEGPAADPETELQRSRGRALRDGSCGWVSICDNKGGILMKPTRKPVMTSRRDVSLLESFDSSSLELQKVAAGTALELLEGPIETSQPSETHVRGSAAKDDAKGWIMLIDSKGNSLASCGTTFFKCVSATALTDIADLRKSKPLRKIDVGEVLEAVDSPDGSAQPGATDQVGAQRRYIRAARDSKEGWVTIMGSRGTVYLEEQTQWKVEHPLSLRATLEPGGKVIRQMTVGEIFKPEDEPTKHTPPTTIGVRFRTQEDPPIVGWVLYSSAEKPSVLMREVR